MSVVEGAPNVRPSTFGLTKRLASRTKLHCQGARRSANPFSRRRSRAVAASRYARDDKASASASTMGERCGRSTPAVVRFDLHTRLLRSFTFERRAHALLVDQAEARFDRMRDAIVERRRSPETSDERVEHALVRCVDSKWHDDVAMRPQPDRRSVAVCASRVIRADRERKLTAP